MYLLCSIYVLLCVKYNFFWCEIFLIQLKVKYFCKSKNNLRPFLDSNLKKKRKKKKSNIEPQRKLWYSYEKASKKISFNACFLATSKYLFPNSFSIMIFPLCDKIMELSRQLFQGFNDKECNSILCNAIAPDTWDSTPEWNYPCLWGNVCT